MVHKNIHDATVGEALTHENGLTVMGFKFEIVEDKTIKNPGMDTLTSMARRFLENQDSTIGKQEMSIVDADGDVNAINFLPFLMDEYFAYHGSLTTGKERSKSGAYLSIRGIKLWVGGCFPSETRIY